MQFGMLTKPPANLFDAFKQIFLEPKLLVLYALTFFAALIIPFLISFGVRKWNQFKVRKYQRVKDDANKEEDEQMELPNGMIGSFNRPMLNSIHEANSKFLKEQGICSKDDPTSPFISRDNLTLRETKEVDDEMNSAQNQQSLLEARRLSAKPEEDDEEEQGDECLDESKPLLQEKKKPRKPRKKYKDPDPETAEALNKLIEQGLHGKLATAQLRAKTQVLEEQMSEEERKKEQQIRQEQLAKIFEMMEAQKEKFGINEKEELVEQMKLYSI